MYLGVLALGLLFAVPLAQSGLAVPPRSPSARPASLPQERPLVIAHRGASGKLPEHTLRAYEQAILDGADYIECDITLTGDLVPVCIHENELSVTTDVETHPEFAGRRKDLVVSGVPLNGWFAIDFSLEELRTLRKKQARVYRDPSFDGRWMVPTLEEHIDVARQYMDRTIGIYPELKDPEWLNGLDIMNGSRFEDIVLEVLARKGYSEASDPCFVQSFSEATLTYLAPLTRLPLVMLIEEDASNATLARWKQLGLSGVGVFIGAVSGFWNVEKGYKNWINGTTDLIARSQAHGLKVHVWTLRNEDRFLAWDWEQDVLLAYDHFLALGAQGFFTDFPHTLTRYLNLLYGGEDGGGGGAVRYGLTAPLVMFSAALLLVSRV